MGESPHGLMVSWCVYVLLGIESRALHMQGYDGTTELCPQFP
jgi:hypothetical protein